MNLLQLIDIENDIWYEKKAHFKEKFVEKGKK